METRGTTTDVCLYIDLTERMGPSIPVFNAPALDVVWLTYSMLRSSLRIHRLVITMKHSQFLLRPSATRPKVLCVSREGASFKLTKGSRSRRGIQSV